MSNLIFFILVVPILIFVLYLGGSAVMAGVKAKEENRTTKEVNDQSEELSDNLDVDPNLSSELIKLNELLKSGVLTQEEFDKAKKKILDN
jgi:archaellum component FlaG (FlaF/FlaG flagellin family)